MPPISLLMLLQHIEFSLLQTKEPRGLATNLRYQRAQMPLHGAIVIFWIYILYELTCR